MFKLVLYTHSKISYVTMADVRFFFLITIKINAPTISRLTMMASTKMMGPMKKTLPSGRPESSSPSSVELDKYVDYIQTWMYPGESQGVTKSVPHLSPSVCSCCVTVVHILTVGVKLKFPFGFRSTEPKRYTVLTKNSYKTDKQV